eukprot:SAG11_NODE_545_length_8621_cov_25.321521_7_plen_173_part_00
MLRTGVTSRDVTEGRYLVRSSVLNLVRYLHGLREALGAKGRRASLVRLREMQATSAAAEGEAAAASVTSAAAEGEAAATASVAAEGEAAATVGRAQWLTAVTLWLVVLCMLGGTCVHVHMAILYMILCGTFSKSFGIKVLAVQKSWGWSVRSAPHSSVRSAPHSSSSASSSA